MQLPNSKSKSVPVSQSRNVPPACHFAWAGSLDALKRYSTSMEPDFSSPDIRGFSPLQYASSAGNPKMTAFLLDKGASEYYQDKALNTALHHAVKSCVFDVVLHLVEHGVPINVQNQFGQTPLVLAAQRGLHKISQYLLENGADINLEDKEGRTPLHHATSEGHVELVDLLIRNGGYLNGLDNQKETALHYAVREGLTNIVELLISYPGIAIDQANEDGETALHLAASFGEVKIVELLIKSGADHNLTTSFGKTALQEALESGQEEVVSLLVKFTGVPSIVVDSGNAMNVDSVSENCVFGMGFLPSPKAAGF